MMRVAQRGMITTTNKYFPVEIHTRILFIHWFSKRIFDGFLKVIGKDWAAGDYMYLLGLRDINKLVENMNIKKCVLLKNRFLGVTATFSLIWYK